MSDIPESDETKAAKEAVGKALRNAYFYAGEHSGFSAVGLVQFAEAIDALIEAKTTDAINALSDRIEASSGIRP